jgi:hypothetical protein
MLLIMARISAVYGFPSITTAAARMGVRGIGTINGSIILPSCGEVMENMRR